MRIEIVGMPHCEKCVELRTYCTMKEIEYTYDENLERLKDLARKHHILTAPVVIFEDGKIYGYNGAVHRLSEIMRRRADAN